MGTTTSGSKSNAVHQQKLPDEQPENSEQVLEKENEKESKTVTDQPQLQQKQKTDLDKRKEFMLLGKSDYFKTEKCFHCKSLGVFICEHDTAILDDMSRYYVKEGTYYKPKIKPVEQVDDNVSNYTRSNSVANPYRQKSVIAKKNLPKKIDNNDDDGCCSWCCKTT